MITVQDLKDFADNSNLRSLAQKLREQHWRYAESILSQMREDSEAEMNRVWCSMPRSAKPSPDDKLARVVPELIVRVIGQRKGAKMNALTIKETEVLNAFNNYFKRFNKTAWQMTEIYGNTVPWATPVQIGYIYWEIESAMLRAGIQVQRDFHKDYVDALVDLQKRGWIELLPTDLFDNVYRMTKEGAEVLKGIQ